MVQHIVLFRLKDSATGQQVGQVRQALLAMKGAIPEIESIAFGPNLGPSVGEYSHVLLVTCRDMDAVQRYLDHPVHRSTVADHVAPLREARLAADMEM